MMSQALRRPAVRRLFAVAGIVVAGWLLGSAGQAHAETVPGPAAHAVLGPVLDGARNTAPTSEQTAHQDVVAPTVETPSAVLHGLVRDVGAPVRGDDILSLPGRFKQVLAGMTPMTRHSDTAASWTPRYGMTAIAGHGDRLGVNDRSPYTGSGAIEDIRGGHYRPHSATAESGLQSGFPCPEAHQGGALPGAAGSVLTGGAGRLARHGVVARPSGIRTAVLGEVPPAVHTAADEPSFSPD